MVISTVFRNHQISGGRNNLKQIDSADAGGWLSKLFDNFELSKWINGSFQIFAYKLYVDNQLIDYI